MTAVATSDPASKSSSGNTPPPEGTEPKLGFLQTVKTFPRSFWMGCVIEMWERLAYYGVRVVMPIYIAQADEPGGLHFSQADKGTIYAWWFIVGSGVPVLSGGFADRYGYKKTIALSVTINILAFTLMANMRSFWGFFFAVMLLALGTALFKPGLQGTLAQSMSKKNSSVGWGLFYWLVNVGAAIGPPFAGFMHMMGWKYVFYGSAAITSLNYLMLLTYPSVESGADKTSNALKVAKDTLVNFFDPKLFAVIAIFSGFWMMLYQLWDFMPNFYADWVDSSRFVASNGWLPAAWVQETARGVQLKQENALNLNAVLIVLFVVPMSFLVRKLPVLRSMTIGILIATIGTLVYGTSPSVYTVFLGILLFSLGEMLTGPKKTEYFALIAPPGKKALYLGYVNIPVAIGPALGAKIVGALYGTYGEKATLSLRYLVEKTSFVQGRAWDGDVASLEAVAGVERKAAFATLVKELGQDPNVVNELLWNTYRPYQVWYPFALVGLCSLVGMIVFSQVSKRWKNMDV
ncbi:MAG: MFS transporter [Labilithrix sp.]|nr:MFS transporter [Labilithrix sp.]MCW5831018.1 MFS transporter [Labilithrix sp.]